MVQSSQRLDPRHGSQAPQRKSEGEGQNWVVVDWFVEGPTHIVRNLAVYRFILFAIIVYVSRRGEGGVLVLRLSYASCDT
jgi:hypothetical protein